MPDSSHTLGWLAAASIIAFTVPAVFSIGLRWEPSLFQILGYTEFQRLEIISAMICRVISNLTVDRESLSCRRDHVIMHMAAVLHGMETTLQVPPHYRWRLAVPQGQHLAIIACLILRKAKTDASLHCDALEASQHRERHVVGSHHAHHDSWTREQGL